MPFTFSIMKNLGFCTVAVGLIPSVQSFINKHGYADNYNNMIDGMIDRIKDELGAETLSVYATGGVAHLIIPHCKHTIAFDEHLVLRGLHIIYKKNL